MPNLAAVIKEEIRRLARRTIKTETSGTKQAVAQFRRDVANLKRQLRQQAKELSFLRSQERKRLSQPKPVTGPLEKLRFSARSVRAQRKRLGLSAENFGKLVGVAGLTIYNWEHGKSRPRAAQFAALVAVRNLGRREAMAKLELAK